MISSSVAMWECSALFSVKRFQLKCNYNNIGSADAGLLDFVKKKIQVFQVKKRTFFLSLIVFLYQMRNQPRF